MNSLDQKIIICSIQNNSPCKLIIAVYLVGSRLWGTFTDKSDYDYLVIVDNKYKGPSSVHDNNSNLTILSYQQFLKNIKNHDFIETICLYSKPIRGSINIKPSIDKELWRKTILYRLSRDIAYANKNQAKNKLRKASRTRFYAILTLVIGTQILEHGNRKGALAVSDGTNNLIDLTAAKKYHSKTWTQENFEPIYQELLQKFKND